MSNVHTLTSIKTDEVKQRGILANKLLEANSLLMPMEERKLISDNLSPEAEAKLNRVFNNMKLVTAPVAMEVLPQVAATVVMYQESLDLMTREMNDLTEEIDAKSEIVNQLSSKLGVFESPDSVRNMISSIDNTIREKLAYKPKVDLSSSRLAHIARAVRKQVNK